MEKKCNDDIRLLYQKYTPEQRLELANIVASLTEIETKINNLIKNK